ncbi:MAG: GNAT family N-acetyltransferase [Limisphaerales bacterium]
MKIRGIEIEDLPSIFEVRIATWHNPNGAEELTQFGITIESVTKMLEDGSHQGWLCEEDGRIVGFTMGDRTKGEMWVIALLKEYEGRGIGRALMNEVEAWLVESGWEETWLTTDVDETLQAVGFYRNLGWEDWKFQDGDRFMRKQFSPGQ